MEKESAQSRKRKFSQRHRKEDVQEPKKFYADGRLLDIEPLKPGVRSNYIVWHRNMEIQCGEKFGDIQTIFTANAAANAYIANHRPVPNEDELGNDPYGIHKSEFNKRMEMFLRKEEELEELKTKAYNYIKRHMSPESWEEAKQDPNWDAQDAQVELIRDPFLLLQAIKRTHTGHRTGVNTIDVENAQNAYQNIRQLSNQSLVAYKDYFDHKVNTLGALGLQRPTEAQQAVKFIRGLDDSRYSELKQHFYNHARAGTGDYPTTLVAAYTVASNHFQKSTTRSSSYGVAYVASKENPKHSNSRHQKTPHDRKKSPWCKFHECNDHWTSDCPEVMKMISKLKDDDQPPKMAAVAKQEKKGKSWVTILHSDFSDKRRYHDFEPTNTDVILDTGATAAIVKERSLLKNIRKAKTIAKIKGVNSEDLTTEWIGDLPNFGEAWYQPKAVANLVPFGRLEKKFNIQYERNFRFYFVAESGTEINFFKVEEDEEGNGLYVYNPNTADFLAAIATVEQNKLGYSKREIRDATVAREFIRRMGYPSNKDAIEMIERGAILDCPVTVQDIVRAQNIFGTDIASLKGKSTHKKSKPIKFDYLPKPKGISSVQNLHADIMFVDGMPYLLTVSQPLNMRMVADLEGSREREFIGNALVKIINQYRSRGFTIDKVLYDSEKGIEACRQLLHAEGIELNLASAGQHVPVIERAIRQVKERIRAIVTTLPYRLPLKLMKYLVDYAVMTINMFPKTTAYDKTSPREQFTGRKLNYRRDLQATFGEYAQVEIPNIVSNETRQPRTEGAIALLPTGNLQGSVLFYILGTGAIVSRETFTALPMPKEVIDKMNSMAPNRKEKGGRDVRISLDESDEEDHTLSEDDLNDQELKEYLPPVREQTLTDHEGLNLEPEAEEDGEPILQEEEHDNEPAVPNSESVHSMPLRRNPKQTDWLILNVSVQQAMKQYREPAFRAILKELKQMRDKGVFEPIYKERLSNLQLKKVIRSFMFLKEKFKADGSFDKLKARLVAGGHMQVESYVNPSSPTASLTAVLMVAAIAAKEEREVATMDIPGAYLNATMEEEVLMTLEPLMTSLLVALAPEFKPFVDEKGILTIRLRKALYGLLESAKLWYDTISKLLVENGFNANPQEPCIFNKSVNDVQCTICLYVDDLMITCADPELLRQVIKELESKFEGTKANIAKVHSYLGMMFNFTEKGQVKITMEGYINEILSFHEVKGKANTPALTSLFDIQNSAALDENKRTQFHSIVAKLLYLAKRVRPDILTTVSFLATRVTKSTEEDWKKLDRLLRYLNYDPVSGIVLRPGDGDIHLTAYADASYGVHEDGKSHSGLCIALGDGPIFVRSSKQKIVSKSSTEAELISLSDGCSQIIWSRDFLIGQGYELPATVVYQDNKSTMSLIDKGRSTSERTRHINVRYYFIKDRVDSGEIHIQHMPTDDMTADILTKPLVGSQFRRLKTKLLNWYF